jgi:GNAT superfamily N-acetyltransferase
MYDVEALSGTGSAVSELARFARSHAHRQFSLDIEGGSTAIPVWVARHRGTMVGFIEARPRTAPHEPPDWARRAGCQAWSWIHKIFVAPEHRRNAVGSRLLLAVVSDGLRAGATCVALNEAPKPLGGEARRAFFVASGLRLVDEEHGVWFGSADQVSASIRRSLAAEDGALAPPAGRAPAKPAP